MQHQTVGKILLVYWLHKKEDNNAYWGVLIRKEDNNWYWAPYQVLPFWIWNNVMKKNGTIQTSDLYPHFRASYSDSEKTVVLWRCFMEQHKGGRGSCSWFSSHCKKNFYLWKTHWTRSVVKCNELCKNKFVCLILRWTDDWRIGGIVGTVRKEREILGVGGQQAPVFMSRKTVVVAKVGSILIGALFYFCTVIH